ncbi:MAG TPA: GNAT family N-acetyltransferase [Solirubrobacteraceae bacterium]|nr:GNAT family N-acetyltransferase [Solirubrobacteraceae bacterium]
MGRLDQVVLAALTAEDWPAAARIFEAGIAAGNATFEPHAPGWEEWTEKRAGYPAVLARDVDGQVLGWAALTPVSPREVYRGVGAVSVYVAPEHTRRGVGRALLNALSEVSEREGCWTLEAGIFPENEASVALHERCGYRLVGVRERIGQMPDGRWRDVLLYERRSAAVGGEG